jgi:hypothetical protein
LVENQKAMQLAPTWPMAHIYYADTLCRLHRAEEAWPHYVDGFLLGTNQQALIALALQCLWDEKAIEPHQAELEKMSEEHKGSWLAYLATDIINNGEKHNGVDPQYRPRSYNGGPRETKKRDSSATSTGTATATTATATTATATGKHTATPAPGDVATEETDVVEPEAEPTATAAVTSTTTAPTR